MQSRVYQSCVGDTVTQNVRRLVKRTKYKVKSNTTECCALMNNHDNHDKVFRRLWDRQNRRGVGKPKTEEKS